jgi:hypothetical protein
VKVRFASTGATFDPYILHGRACNPESSEDIFTISDVGNTCTPVYPKRQRQAFGVYLKTSRAPATSSNIAAGMSSDSQQIDGSKPLPAAYCIYRGDSQRTLVSKATRHISITERFLTLGVPHLQPSQLPEGNSTDYLPIVDHRDLLVLATLKP